MRVDEAGRPRVRWHSHVGFKRISNVAGHVSAAALLVAGTASSFAARKNKPRNQDREGRKEDEARDREGNKDRDGQTKRETNREQDRDVTSERSGTTDHDGGRNRIRDRKHEQETSESTNDDRQVTQEQKNKTEDSADETETTETADTESGNGGGGGGGGGNSSGNAGSGLFDNPLATKTRRRANDFENRDPDTEDDGIFIDVDSDGESVFETDSVFLATGPDGLEIETDNITYFAEPTPTPTPVPALELPVRDPDYPFGEDFPFGVRKATGTRSTSEPRDTGDTGDARDRPSDRTPFDSDGGDNTMDFTS